MTPTPTRPEPTPYWVIESIGPKYWSGRKRDSESFSEKIADAIRFADKGSAEVVRCWMLLDDVQRLTKSIEHMDVKP